LQTPIALALVGVIAADMYFGLGLAPIMLALAASVATALGVPRPTELATKVAKALPPLGGEDEDTEWVLLPKDAGADEKRQ
jgi:hypothetical protein